jgi:ectoine hydroxylase-related dioxygenase (phytanoyl-CoA dioxygenase family)
MYLIRKKMIEFPQIRGILSRMETNSTAKPLREDQIEEYYREGFLVVRGLVSIPRIDSMLEEARNIPAIEGGGWTPKAFSHDQPEQDFKLHQLLIDPPIVAAVEQIIESAPRVYYGMVAIVPARGGRGLAWHQDNMYDVILGRALNVFIACCEITPDKAILWVAPRTHLMGVQESELVDGHRSAKAPPNGMPLPTLHKGDAVIFDRNTLHHSKRNETDEHRYAYAAQYMESNARSGVTGRKDPKKMLARELAQLWCGHQA